MFFSSVDWRIHDLSFNKTNYDEVFVQKQSADDLCLLIMNKNHPVDKTDEGIACLLCPQASFRPTFVFGGHSCYYTELR